MKTVIGRDQGPRLIIVIMALLFLGVLCFFVLASALSLFIIMALIILCAIRVFREMMKTILVDENGVELNGNLYPYNEIVSASSKGHNAFMRAISFTLMMDDRQWYVAVKLTSGKVYKYKICNGKEVDEAINSNMNYLKKVQKEAL